MPLPDPEQTFDIALAAASLALFAVSFAGAVLATRPLRPRAAPATQDLGDEPPAVVNLLANSWRLDEGAVEATLLDLAARRHLELRQPGDSASDTTVHLRPPRDAVPGALTRYEQQMLGRVRELAVDGERLTPLVARPRFGGSVFETGCTGTRSSGHCRPRPSRSGTATCRTALPSGSRV